MCDKLLAPLMRPFAKRFFAGTTLEQELVAIRAYNAKGIGVIANLVGEHPDRPWSDPDLQFRITEDEYRRLIGCIREERLRASFTIKLTQFGLDLDESMARAAVHRLCEFAAEHFVPVEFDMEESRYTGLTLDIFQEVAEYHPYCRIALQARLSRTADDIAWLNRKKLRVRLTKGTYPEGLMKPDAIRRAYLECAQELLANGKDPAFATVRDEALIAQLKDLAGAIKKPLRLQMLYGFRPKLQERLAQRQAVILEVYVPYGKERNRAAYASRRLGFFGEMYCEDPWRPWQFIHKVWKIYRD